MNEDEFKIRLQTLSKQEVKILKLFLQGKNDVVIAMEIANDAEIAMKTAKKVSSKPKEQIKLGTVKCHISRICSKFDLIKKGNRGYDHRDELIDLFIRYKGEWVSNDVRTLPRLGYPKWEDPDSNRHIERTGSNFYLEQVKRCRDNLQVIKLLEKAVKGDRSDPYAQIYLNNAKARLQGNPLKIGVVIAKAGNDFHEFASIQVLRGVADAQTQFNESRHKGERWLEIDIRNDGNNESDAKAVAKDYVNDPKIIAVFGHHSSEATKVALRIYEERSVALISPTSTSSQLESKIFFRTIGSTKAVASKYVQYIREKLGLDQIAVLHHINNEYSQTLKTDFEKAFRRDGGKIIYPIQDMSDPELDIDGLITFIKTKTKAMLVISSIEVNSVAIAIARANYELQSQKLQLLFTTSLPETLTIQKGGEAVEGVVLANPCLDDNSDYVQTTKTRWGQQEVNWRVATSYDAMQALIEAIKLSEELSEIPTRKAILQNLERLNLSADQTSGFGLSWSNLDYHSNAQRPYCITQIRNHRFEKIF